ncbi:MAG: hypothetical protein WCR51_04155 [Planctomycetia bacterium]
MRGAPSQLACAVVCACALAGCRFAFVADQGWAWRQPAAVDSARAASTTRKPAPKTLPLEIVFARIDDHDVVWHDELWNLADEQFLDHDLRRRLAANGLRSGLLTGPLPPHLAARLEPALPASEADDRAAPPGDRPAVMRRLLSLLPGRDTEVIAATGLDELILLEHDGGEVHGGTYHDATAYFALKAWPAADGRMRLDMVPTVKHGPIEREWVGEEGAFRLETGQKRQPLERLALTTTIPQGGTLLIGATGDASSTAGDAFFRDDSSSRRTRRLLAIRPQGRPIDPLFTDVIERETAPPGSAAN